MPLPTKKVLTHIAIFMLKLFLLQNLAKNPQLIIQKTKILHVVILHPASLCQKYEKLFVNSSYFYLSYFAATMHIVGSRKDFLNVLPDLCSTTSSYKEKCLKVVGGGVGVGVWRGWEMLKEMLKSISWGGGL